MQEHGVLEKMNKVHIAECLRDKFVWEMKTGAAVTIMSKDVFYDHYHSSKVPKVKQSEEMLSMAPNDTAYRRWSCHSGQANPVQIVSTPRAPINGGAITVF